jgi:microsomal dipeptidase-like Zn-dependent dipeptidase
MSARASSRAAPPCQVDDCSKFENVTYALLKRGVPEATIRKVWGENTLRVMKQVEDVAARMRTGS